MRILSVLSARSETIRNRTEHGLSWLTTISDAGSTPAASTKILKVLYAASLKRTIELPKPVAGEASFPC